MSGSRSWPTPASCATPDSAAATEVERLLKDPKSQRFVEDFLGQWLKLRQIAANDPDRKLYPEFSPYLQDSMVAETRAYFRELLDKNLDASYLVKSDFAMLNEKLAVHYGIPGVSGSQIRRVALARRLPARRLPHAGGDPEDHRQRHDDLAGAARRVRDGPPARPAARAAAAEHPGRRARRPRAPGPSASNSTSTASNAACASCHAKIDPPGFALESFDVIGGFRTRYRSIGAGDPAPRGSIDPFIGISFKLGPTVDASGVLPDGRSSAASANFRRCWPPIRTLLLNLAQQFTIYATGREVVFSDRQALNEIVARTEKQGGGIRTLLHEFVESQLFQNPLEDPPCTPFRHAFTCFCWWVSVYCVLPAPMRAEEPGTRYGIIGLFSPERKQDFRELLADLPEIQLVRLDYDTAEVTLRYDLAKLFPNYNPKKPPTPEQVLQRLNGLLVPASQGSFRLVARSTVPAEKLTKLEIDIGILDCKACRFGAYRVAMRLDGVERATVTCSPSRVTVWIDATKTNRAAVENALKKAGVGLAAK